MAAVLFNSALCCCVMVVVFCGTLLTIYRSGVELHNALSPRVVTRGEIRGNPLGRPAPEQCTNVQRATVFKARETVHMNHSGGVHSKTDPSALNTYTSNQRLDMDTQPRITRCDSPASHLLVVPMRSSEVAQSEAVSLATPALHWNSNRSYSAACSPSDALPHSNPGASGEGQQQLHSQWDYESPQSDAIPLPAASSLLSRSAAFLSFFSLDVSEECDGISS